MDKNKLKKLFGDKDHLPKRYIIFLIGMAVCALGVAAMTESGLGTSPVTTIPYVLSLFFPRLSFGTWVIVFCFMQMAVQIILLRKNCIISELVLQGILAFLFGYMTDFSMFLMRGIPIESYRSRMIMLLVGCVVLAFGIFLELKGNVAMLSPEAFVWAFTKVLNKPYGNIKIISDLIMSIFAGILCYAALGYLDGVREGTFIAAFILGALVRVMQRFLDPVIAKDLKPDP